ncbi:addiction module protein [Ornithinicoccus hortensis]|uniref:Putative addiction module component n=1 Tax=Ornithinicoccus hortensis TaxID=82346 RepID=A0A542YWB6_9MICO|nr:addiction module protein [Ornithinicoccus hortensis]TQL52375.1 putative addiction module component [Ornithinicoccus hortensis]
MTLAEVIRAAMALSPEERSRVADVLYEADEADQSAIDAAWASVVALRADELESGAVRTLTREEADAYLDARAAARDA